MPDTNDSKPRRVTAKTCCYVALGMFAFVAIVAAVWPTNFAVHFQGPVGETALAALIATVVAAAAWFGEIGLLREEYAACIAPKRTRAQPGWLWVAIFSVVITAEILLSKWSS